MHPVELQQVVTRLDRAREEEMKARVDFEAEQTKALIKGLDAVGKRIDNGLTNLAKALGASR
jgi:hypothetical protein